ncbi:hypothetical protein OAF96_01220 [bacterium]|nr:hypothetical protein [bacterium]
MRGFSISVVKKWDVRCDAQLVCHHDDEGEPFWESSRLDTQKRDLSSKPLVF